MKVADFLEAIIGTAAETIASETLIIDLHS
jgi:hypothetical protein